MPVLKIKLSLVGLFHYFEEDSIQGTLYNEDGTEYDAERKITIAPKTTIKTVVKEEKKQATLFDFMDLNANEGEEELEEELQEEIELENTINKVKETPSNVDIVEDRIIDIETGEVIKTKPNKANSIDKELAIILYEILDGKLEVK